MTTTPKSEFERELERYAKDVAETTCYCANPSICSGCESNSQKLIAMGARWAQEYLRTKVDRLEAENSKLRAALESISKNGCCGTCQEAKLVALKALGGEE